MLLAELNIRHTRRHMPTRRVALDDGYLPTSGAAYGAVLLGAVVAEHVGDLDEEQRDAAAPAPRRRARRAPGAADRAALPAPDRHCTASTAPATGSLARGRAALRRSSSTATGRPAPQVIGAVMAAAALRPSSAGARRSARSTPRSRRPGCSPRALEVRRLLAGRPGHARRPAPGASGPGGTPSAPTATDAWRGVPVRAAVGDGGARPARRACASSAPTCSARFRRLVRLAHPDHGGAHRRRGRAHRRARRGPRAAPRARSTSARRGDQPG